MYGRLGMVVSVLALGATAIRADMGTVITKDGRTLQGDITEEGDQVRINRGGIVMVLNRDQIKEIRTETSSADEYAQRLKKLTRDDIGGHFRLAEWCRDRGMLDKARERCEYVLSLDPDHANAKLLLKAVNKRSRRSTDAKSAPEEAQAKEGPKTTWRRGDLLDKEQISRIRLAEVRPGERVNVRFKNDVLDRFLEAVAGTDGYNQRDSRANFMAKSNADKLAGILDATGMHFADDIEVRSDPESIRVFKSDIMPTIKTSCTSLKCHGNSGAPKIRLYTQNTPAAVYTNFYNLDRFEKAVPGRGKALMFDRGYPEDGLFPHYLLPKSLSDPALAHPGDIEPAVRGKDARQYTMALDWIKEVLKHPRVDAGIEPKPDEKDKVPPGAKPTSRAAEKDKRSPPPR
ncbi:MAG: hypothetical protein JXQ73_12425 [Phycisphaerae bacterium]|nr:hypothetical protein [Phycisphaerae bacterium]